MNKITEHHFNIDDAKKYDIEKAVLLYNLVFWLEKNKVSGRNIHRHTDGKPYHWTYNSALAFQELFPYMSERSISRKLKELKDDGAILVNNFNKTKYDRTAWYTMPCFELILKKRLNGESIRPQVKSLSQNDGPIPDNKPYSKHISSLPSQSSGNNSNEIVKKPSPLYKKYIRKNGTFKSTEYIREVLAVDSQRSIGLIAIYLEIKGMLDFMFYDELKVLIGRNIKVANAIVKYPQERVSNAIEYVKKFDDWNLDTVRRYLNDPKVIK